MIPEALPHAYHDLGQAMLGLGRLDDAASWFARGWPPGRCKITRRRNRLESGWAGERNGDARPA